MPCAGYADCYIFDFVSCDNLSTYANYDDLCRVCGLIYFYLCQLWRPVPGKQRVIFLPMPAVPRALVLFFNLCHLCQVCGLLYFYLCQLWRPVPGIQSVIFPLMPDAPICFLYLCQLCQTVTNCVGYVYCYISTYASCAGCAKFCFSTYSNCARLWRPVLGMWIVIFLPIPAVTTCAGQTEGYIFTYASCAEGASVVFLPMPPVPGMRIVIFLPMPAVTTCAGYTECYISTYASAPIFLQPMPSVPGCDDLCWVCGLLYFPPMPLWRLVPGMWTVIFLPMPAAPSFVFLLYSNCGRLWRFVPGMWTVIFLPMPAVTTCAGYVQGYISTYASCDDLCQVCALSYFYLCQLWWPVSGMWIVIYLPRC